MQPVGADNELLIISNHTKILISQATAVAAQNEEFHGNGTARCFGRMVVTLDKPRPGSREGMGHLSCLPWFSPTVAPQGFIIDGEDNSHWVSSYCQKPVKPGVTQTLLGSRFLQKKCPTTHDIGDVSNDPEI